MSYPALPEALMDYELVPRIHIQHNTTGLGQNKTLRIDAWKISFHYSLDFRSLSGHHYNIVFAD